MTLLDAKTLDSLKIILTISEDIATWSYGEVKRPEATNYRTLRPEHDGLLGEQIFGPARDWKCACGKYKRVRYEGIVREKYGVEVTRSKVRRERMGHIDLAVPVTHTRYLKGVPSRLGYVLDLAPGGLEKVIYFAAYMVMEINKKSRDEDLTDFRQELEIQKKWMENQRGSAINDYAEEVEADPAALEADGTSVAEREKLHKNVDKGMARIHERFDGDIRGLKVVWENFKNLKVGTPIGDEHLYRMMLACYGTYFKGGVGATAIQKHLEAFDLQVGLDRLCQAIASDSGPRKAHTIKRLRVINAFIVMGNSPISMVLTKIPVVPPGLRPMAQLDGERFATSDLNDLYRRVISRNTRLKRLPELGAPEIIMNSERRMLQESVDAFFDNGRRGHPVAGPGNRPLKSISNMLKGKQGRFRQSLLGKRVDYSGCSVIVVGPQLKLHQCGLPKQVAFELFRPFVMKRLVEKNYAQNVKAAEHEIERQRPEVWDALDDVVREYPILLNRAPALHRPGIQASEPQFIEGKTVQLHPLACGVFNTGFDDDQMAVHLSLGAEVQAGAHILMLSMNNILKPSSDCPVAMPSQDMIVGLFHLTLDPDPTVKAEKDTGGKEIPPTFSPTTEAQMALGSGNLDLNIKVLIRFEGIVPPLDQQAPEEWESGDDVLLETTLGHAIFNEQSPVDYPYANGAVGKERLDQIVNNLIQRYPSIFAAECLDAPKSSGFHQSIWLGITIAFSDIQASPRKGSILADYEARAAAIQDQHETDTTTEDNRCGESVKL